MFIHFETRKEYLAWALGVLYAGGDKNNSNATGNALDQAKKCVDLMWPESSDGPATERDQYLAWALVVVFAESDKTNSNAVGNALDHALRCAELIYPKSKTDAIGVPSLPMQQPPRTPSVSTSVQGKAPPVPGERAEVPAMPVPTTSGG